MGCVCEDYIDMIGDENAYLDEEFRVLTGTAQVEFEHRHR
jgi:hypothetical protein